MPLLWSGRSRQPRQAPSSGSVSVFNLITTALICLAENRIEDGGQRAGVSATTEPRDGYQSAAAAHHVVRW